MRDIADRVALTAKVTRTIADWLKRAQGELRAPWTPGWPVERTDLAEADKHRAAVDLA